MMTRIVNLFTCGFCPWVSRSTLRCVADFLVANSVGVLVRLIIFANLFQIYLLVHGCQKLQFIPWVFNPFTLLEPSSENPSEDGVPPLARMEGALTQEKMKVCSFRLHGD